MQDLWVFAYGSLMWQPGFEYEERAGARLHGYHRAFCVYSHVHRGTPERPGLVFGLDAGGSCRGIAFRVAAEKAAATRAYLEERELVTSVYHDRMKQIELISTKGATHPARVEALCFLVDRTHEQYAGKLDFETTVRLIAEGEGRSGRNPDYLFATVDHLRAIGIHDAPLEALDAAVRERLPVGPR